MDSLEAVEKAASWKQKPLLEAMAHGESDVQRFYKDAVIFITGGSGFLGKQLIEKLLRSCQVSKLYILLRPKRGKDAESRLKEMLEEPVFDTLRQKHPTFGEKIIAIAGNNAELKLGIKYDDWKTLTDEVDIIFHMSATTKFNEPLRTATLVNLRGTREALCLGKACTKLRSFVFVSTAFCCATKNLIGCEVREQFYRSPIPPDALISMAENMDVDTLNKITNDLTNGWPNTYTFTKSVAEELIRTTTDGFPICIMRPAVGISSYCEPYPGWIDKNGIYGACGLINGYTIGAIRAFYLNPKVRAAFIPCDYVNNAIIVAAQKVATSVAKGGNETKIYALSSTNRNPITFKMAFDAVNTKEGKKLKSTKYHFRTFSCTRMSYMMMSLLLHRVPANVADLLYYLKKKQRKFTMFAKKLDTLSCALSYFSLNEWNFVDNNLETLFSELSTQDQAIFNFDITDIDWNEYFLFFIAGCRKYLNKIN